MICSDAIMQLLSRDRRFSARSYDFVQDVLEYALFVGVPSNEETLAEYEENEGHISGETLCRFAVDYAAAQFGYMAREVLAQLGIHTTSDIGDIVYNLISVGEIAQSSSDSRDDFDNLFDLESELEKSFEFAYERRRRN